jgi:hypothetical protein
MRWSKVRKLVEESFAPSVRERVTLHFTNHRYAVRHPCDCGYARIDVDQAPIAHFDTHLSYKLYGSLHDANIPWPSHPDLPGNARTAGLLVEPGEFSRHDLTNAMWAYIHLYTLDESLASPNPLIASLAVLDSRVGKHRLRRISERHLHPLTRALLEFRVQAEAA